MNRTCYARSLTILVTVIIFALGYAFTTRSAAQTPPTLLAANSLGQQTLPKAEEPSYLRLSPETRGDLLVAYHRYMEAISAYRDAPQDSAIVWNKLGVANHHLFNIREAQRDYEVALKLKPDYPEARNNLGAIYYGQKDYTKAERCYRKAIKLSPKSAAFYSNLGTAYLADGKYQKSADAYRKALALDPDVFERDASAKIAEASTTRELAALNYLLALTYAHAGRYNEALNYLRKALDEGFDDRKKLMGEKEFASLRGTPEFRQLIAERLN